jgi:poly(3-hydroxybutyrate) depolymerase
MALINFSGDKTMNKLLLSTLLISTILLGALSLSAGAGETADIDTGRVTVSGLSAGGAMAQQLHIAYSDVFSGAGIIAGVPFGCADNSLGTAMSRCTGKTDDSLSVEELAAGIKTAAGDGNIASTENLADDRVWLFHGTLDTTVAAAVSDATAALYAEFIPGAQISTVNDVEAGHNFPARGNGHACAGMEAPFVGDCDYDAAGEMLQTLYPGLETSATEAKTELKTVTLPGAGDAGLSDTAYLFVPPACSEGGQECALHLVLHGCAQSALSVGTGFIEQSGYLSWAESNDIVMAFPQVAPGMLNPYACWDWWGYTGAEYRWRTSKQMQVLTDWIKNLQVTGPDN